jgi:hypothetical protein
MITLPPPPVLFPPPLGVRKLGLSVAVPVPELVPAVVVMVNARVMVARGVGDAVRVGLRVGVLVIVGVAVGLNAPYTVFAGPEIAITSIVSRQAKTTPPMP